MTRFRHILGDRNLLYAFAVLAPVVYLLAGHVIPGLVFLLCVVAARFSRERAPQRRRPGGRRAPSEPSVGSTI